MKPYLRYAPIVNESGHIFVEDPSGPPSSSCRSCLELRLLTDRPFLYSRPCGYETVVTPTVGLISRFEHQAIQSIMRTYLTVSRRPCGKKGGVGRL